MQTVYITPNERRAFLAAIKAGMVFTSMRNEPGAFTISGVDIEFRVHTDTPTTQKETE
jgi:hypothetical protein